MKKIIILCIIFFISLMNTSRIFASTECKYSYTNLTSIEVVEYNGLYKITASKLITDEYYLLDINHYDGTDIDDIYYSEDEIEKVDVDDSSFKLYSSNIHFDYSYDNFFIFKPKKDTVNFSLTNVSDFKFSIQKRMLGLTESKIDVDSNIQSDLINLGIINDHIIINENKLLGIIPGDYNGIDSTYLYIYMNDDNLLDDIGLKTISGKDYSLSLSYINSYNSIQKYRLNSFDTNILENINEEFIITSYNYKDYGSRMNLTEFGDQLISYFVEKNSGKKTVDFGVLENSFISVKGVSKYYDHSSPKWYPWATTGDVSRFHYLLFDVFVDNQKMNLFEDNVIINEMTISKSPVTVKTDVIEGSEYYWHLHYNSDPYNDYDTVESFVDGHVSFNSKFIYDYVDKIDTQETIVLQTHSYSKKSEVTNLGDWLGNIFGWNEREFTFPTIGYVNDDNLLEQFQEVDFTENDYTYDYVAFYNSYYEDNRLRLDTPGVDTFFHYSLPGDGSDTSNRITYRTGIYVEKVNVLELQLNHEGVNYKLSVDDSDISDTTPGDKFPVGPEEESSWNKFLIWFEELFGFSFYIICIIVGSILGIVVIVLLALYAQPLLKLIANIMMIPIKVINKMFER